MLDDGAIDLRLEDCLWLANGSRMNCGTKLRRCSLPSRPSPEAAVSASRTASVSWASCSCCVRAVPGTICPPNWAAATAPPAGVGSESGPQRASGQQSGAACSTASAKKAVSIFHEPSSTALPCGRFLGGSHGAKPHRSPQEGHETPFGCRRSWASARPQHNGCQRAGRQGCHCAAGRDSTHPGASWPATIPPRRVSRRPGVWLGSEHPRHAQAPRPAAVGTAQGRHAWLGLGQDAMGSGGHPVVVQAPSPPAAVLRAKPGKSFGPASDRGRPYLCREACSSSSCLNEVLQ